MHICDLCLHIPHLLPLCTNPIFIYFYVQVQLDIRSYESTQKLFGRGALIWIFQPLMILRMLTGLFQRRRRHELVEYVPLSFLSYLLSDVVLVPFWQLYIYVFLFHLIILIQMVVVNAYEFTQIVLCEINVFQYNVYVNKSSNFLLNITQMM